MMDTQQSRHVVLKDTPSDLVTPPVLPVQMPATQTLPTISHDRAAVVPPIVTPVTIVEDPRSRMDRLEQRIRRMRDLDEMISWDDLDDVPVATLPVGFRMPDIERYTGVGCPRIHLRLYSTVMRALGLDEAQLLTLFPLSLSGMTQRWYASLETSRRRTWEDLAQEFLRQYSFSGDTSVTRRELEFLRQGSDEFAQHLTGVPFQDFRSLVQALIDVDDGISKGLWSDIIPSSDTEGKGVGGSSESYGDVCSADFQHRRPGYHPYARSLQTPRSDFPPLQHRHPHPTSIPRHEQSHPHRRRQRTYSDLGMPLDRAFERLRSTGFLVPLAPSPFPSTMPPRFRAHEVLDSFSVVTGPRAEIDGMMVMIFSEYIEIRLLQLRFTMSDEIAPITLTTLYEMMVDLTQRVERIELTLSEYPSSSRGAPGVAMPSLPHLTSPTPVTLGASHPRSHPHSVLQQHSSFISLATLTRPPSRLRGPPAMGFLAPLAPRALPDPDIVDSGTFGHPQSDMFPIPTSAQAMHADAPSPAVPDLIDLGD
ncbi:hypothetical protein CK203_099934 [Vitis vinifera]|uniref:Retrotransposon gag domain-containing protein n=1 Tax=Vitis vinifera TaxID=29760 RepID=A0A438CYK7_VITVI|nr:hypothetical protein CK203_099934 [Vitis vinifera]